MKKQLPHILMPAALAVILMACGLQSPAEPTQDVSLVHTQAALTFEAQLATQAATQMMETEIYNTVVAQITQAAATAAAQFPSETPPPPTETATATQPPTATFAPDGFRASLGAPTWLDTFLNASNWYIYEEDDSSTQVKDGKFHMTAFKPRNFSMWTLSWRQIEDFYLETVAETPKACAGKDRYGLIFRAPDLDHGYLYALSCDGMYRLAKWDGKTFAVLVNWTANPAIKAGPNQVNVMGVKAEGDKLSLYANGVFLTDVRDDDYTAAGRFGFLIGAEQTANLIILFDQIAYWLMN